MEVGFEDPYQLTMLTSFYWVPKNMRENVKEKKIKRKSRRKENVKENKKINLKSINHFIFYFKFISLIFLLLCKD